VSRRPLRALFDQVIGSRGGGGGIVKLKRGRTVSWMRDNMFCVGVLDECLSVEESVGAWEEGVEG
jgi:hypothetical protein